MKYFRCSSLLKLVVLPLTLTLWLAACTSYKTLSPPYAESIASENPDAVRVTLHDETQIDLAQPTCASDTLVGLDYNWDRDSEVHMRSIKVAVKDIASIEIENEESNYGARTAAVLFGLVTIGYLAICGGFDPMQGC